ncbi:MAG: GNAT family N-acetyltransferase [Cyclobacteriaceae bacterium]|nr:GNAT family N-acetyltransferase [Cyclobacteriaceae bacterium]MCK5470339.1 GNAT family N-acetyltransferase [Cyclobacteriaceae bacterium]MCK5700403.1 GNAT family N-acetyltransferase [Cyclobacteriaceae bacterium]
MIKIREANRSDAPSIIDFQLKMALETENLELTKSVVESGVKAVFDEDSKGAYYVAEVDGTVVGSLLTTYEWSDWRNGQILWIQSVYVANEFRGKGIYRNMYEYIKNKVRDHKLDFKGIRLYVDKTNGVAQKVYKKLGMENHHYEMYEWMM